MATKIKEIVWVFQSLLDVDPVYNRRDEYEDIPELMDSIIENGVVTPLVVYEVEQDDKSVRYTVISGHRRREAARRLVEEGFEDEKYDDFKVPVIIDTNSDKVDMMARIIVDNDSKPLKPLEEASVFYTLKEFGLSVREISKRCGRKEKTVYDYLLLFSADEEMKAMIREGTMSVYAVIDLLKKEAQEHKKIEDEINMDAFGGDNKESENDVSKQINELPVERETSPKKKGSISIEALERLIEQMEEMGDEGRKEDAFALTYALIQWGTGDLDYSELASVYFNDITEINVKQDKIFYE